MKQLYMESSLKMSKDDHTIDSKSLHFTKTSLQNIIKSHPYTSSLKLLITKTINTLVELMLIILFSYLLIFSKITFQITKFCDEKY
jgi:hypothetical protein